ncbi:tyrosyl-tRNA synthetase [Clostridium acetobutylicum]|nr:tyrosyl-tRNA synthetase [Clostridium acetobutylicum]
MSNVLDELIERGYAKQFTHEEETRKLLSEEKVTFYIGFDPTGDSLHVGHFIALMLMARMQKAGHRPIVLIGGGTAMVGDPTGKTDMRKMLTREEINHNVECLKKQMSRFIDFSDDKAIIVNNADWLMEQNYIEFLREVGVHFSVNKMLTAECFKQRMEKGLSFLEFNYMLMQGFDFYKLNEKYDCKMELGGDDQWSNMIAGVELIRRKSNKKAYAMTSALLTNSEGKKMGKTEKGALWLDAEKTSPYDFFQYWRNVNDADVEKCLSMLTFLPMDEVRRLASLKDQEINKAKEVLAYEVTKLVHGEEEAKKALNSSKALFGGGTNMDNVPTVSIPEDMLSSSILDVLVHTKIIPSKGEGRRLVQQGGITLNDTKVEDFNYKITKEDFNDDGFALVRRGKKKYYKIVIG